MLAISREHVPAPVERKEAHPAFETSKTLRLNLRIEIERLPSLCSPRIPLFQTSFQPDNRFTARIRHPKRTGGMAQAQSRARRPCSGVSSALPSACSPWLSCVAPTQIMYESTKQMICIVSRGKLVSDPVRCFDTILIASSLIPIVRAQVC